MTEYSSLVVIRSSKNEKIGQDQLVAFTRAEKYDDFQIWRYKNSKWQNFGSMPDGKFHRIEILQRNEYKSTKFSLMPKILNCYFRAL